MKLVSDHVVEGRAGPGHPQHRGPVTGDPMTPALLGGAGAQLVKPPGVV